MFQAPTVLIFLLDEYIYNKTDLIVLLCQHHFFLSHHIWLFGITSPPLHLFKRYILSPLSLFKTCAQLSESAIIFRLSPAPENIIILSTVFLGFLLKYVSRFEKSNVSPAAGGKANENQ